jgi:predicted Fe-Mo cluster-binding NifX family protein
LVFENGKLIKTMKNPFRIGGGGAGYSVAEMLSDEKIDLVVSGKFGTNMKTALESKNIKYKEISGITIKQALEKI